MDGSYVLTSRQQAQDTLTGDENEAKVDESSAPPTPTLSAIRPAASPPVKKRSRQYEIVNALNDRDLNKLAQLSSERGGFETNELRKRVWPILLDSTSHEFDKPAGPPPTRPNAEPSTPDSSSQAEFSDSTVPHSTALKSKDELEPHSDERQVHLDIMRSFVSYPTEISPNEKEILRSKLENVIVTILRRFPALQYFQGYHDIISVLLLTLEDEQITLRAVQRMSLHRIRDNMGKNLEPVLGYLRLVHRILAKADENLANVVEMAAALPYFSLSWVLTLMSHDLTSIDVIARLFDFLLAHNPAMISYLGVAIILLKRDELAKLDQESREDPSMLHHVLSKLPNLVLEPSSETNLLPDQTQPESKSENFAFSRSRSNSVLTESTISLAETENSIGASSPATTVNNFYDRDEKLISSLDLSLDALEDSMLTDPDVHDSLFLQDTPNLRPSPPPSPPTRQQIHQPAVSVDDLISSTLELWRKFPLLAENSENKETDSILADEIMGPKSCIFTWSLSAEGRLSDDDCHAIAIKGEDIVLPEKVPEPENLAELEKTDPLARRAKQRRELQRRKQVQMSIGTTLAIVGIVGVVLAVYGVPPSWKSGGGSFLKSFRQDWRLSRFFGVR